LQKFCASVKNIHEHENVIAFGSSNTGQFLIWCLASLLLSFKLGFSAVILSIAIASIQIAPSHRNKILAIGAVVAAYLLYFKQATFFSTNSHVIPAFSTIVLLACTYALYHIGKRYGSLPALIRKNPLIFLHIAYFALIPVLALIGSDSGFFGKFLWIFTLALPFFLCRWGYMLNTARRGKMAATKFVDHLLYVSPVFGGSNVPYGKGHENLHKNAVIDRNEIARSQLAGLKLIILVWLYVGINELMMEFIYTQSSAHLSVFNAGIPRLSQLVGAEGTMQASGRFLAWASMFFELITQTLELAIRGHLIIGCLRLFGINVFRNTYKPLLSTSILEFWNRFYYYFKELMVECFFFPAYLSFSQYSKKVRLFIATFAAAFVGNLYYHFLIYMWDWISLPPDKLAQALLSRTMYTLLLACGIYISQLRLENHRKRKFIGYGYPGVLRKIRAIGGVWLFFSCIHIYNLHVEDVSFLQRSGFLLWLFGVQ